MYNIKLFKILRKSLKNLCVILKDEFLNNMKKFLKLKDFTWIIVNKENKEGYYSYKINNWELAIDWIPLKGWSVFLCNKFEEVLEEYGCSSKEEAIIIVNKIYKSSVI